MRRARAAALLVSLLLFAACGGGDSSRDASAATEATEATDESEPATTTSATTPVVVGEDWVEVESDTMEIGTVTDVAASSTEIVAVGLDDAEPANPIAWRSVDGLEWEHLELPNVAHTLIDKPVVAYGPDGFVTLVEFMDEAADRWGQLLWLSPNGTDWELLEPEATGLLGDWTTGPDYELRPSRVGALAWFGQWLGVGTGGWHRDYETGGESGEIWLSPDGRMWETFSENGEPFGGPAVNRQMNAAATDGRRIVAGGYTTKTDGADITDAFAWWSDDGRTWQRGESASFAGPADERIHAMAFGAAGWVAVGTDTTGYNGHALAWHSADGVTWEAATVGNGGQMWDVVATEAGYVAAGVYDEDSSSAVVWKSADGVMWTMIESESLMYAGSSEIRHVVAFRGGLVAIGDGGDVWTSGL